VQLHLLAAPSVQVSSRGRDVFLAGDLYGGMGNATSFFSAHVVGEARRLNGSGLWDGMVGNGLVQWYAKPSPVSTTLITLEASAVRRLDFPAQLTFADGDGGLQGFVGARAAGGERAVMRVEQRRDISWPTPKADWAIAVFADAGQIWAGDVPYGVNTPVRAAAGFSIMTAYPTGSKRTYRADIAIPINPERGMARIEFRLSALDRTQALWIEPRDVLRLRSGAVPWNLMTW
jgi:hypothetical protein